MIFSQQQFEEMAIDSLNEAEEFLPIAQEKPGYWYVVLTAARVALQYGKRFEMGRIPDRAQELYDLALEHFATVEPEHPVVTREVVAATRNSRGFLIFGDPIETGRATVRMYESSNAIGLHVWLSIDDATREASAAAELDVHQVRALMARCQTFLDAEKERLETRWGIGAPARQLSDEEVRTALPVRPSALLNIERDS